MTEAPHHCPALERLADMQRTAFARRNIDDTDVWPEAALEALVREAQRRSAPTNYAWSDEEHATLMAKILGARQTPFDNPYLAMMLREWKAHVIAAAETLKFVVAPHWEIGLLPYRSVNARMIPVAGDYLVVLDLDLIRFISFFARSLIRAIPHSEDEVFDTDVAAVRKCAQGETEAFDLFRVAVLEYALEGDFVHREAPPLNESTSLRDFILRDATFRFIVAHEYAHILTHVAGATPRDGDEEISWSHAQEYAADALAALIVVVATHQRGRRRETALHGPVLLFVAWDILLRTLAELRQEEYDGTRSTSAHPAPLQRIAGIYRSLEAAWSDVDAAPLLKDMLQQMAIMVAAAEELFARLLPELRALAARGTRPHPMWRVSEPSA